MAFRNLLSGTSLILVLIPALALTAEEPDGNWPSFRGPKASGVAHGSQPPVEWDAESGKHVAWKTPIPGLGHSSPVIWGDRLFLTTAVSGADAELKVGLYGDGQSAADSGPQSWRVLSIDKNNGELLWQRTAHQGRPKIQRHPKASHASSTPATDGRHVVAMFGSEGLHGYTIDGKLLWRKDFGVLHSGSFRSPDAQWGFGSSPVLHDGKVIVQANVLAGSFLAVFDADDGREIWRRKRVDHPGWSSPTVHSGTGGEQILVNGYKHIGGYALKDGTELWRMRGGGDLPVPTPVVAHGLAFITNSHRASPIYAVRLTARGDVSLAEDTTANQHVAWSEDRNGAYMQTPLVVGDNLYVCRDNGVLSCFDAASGKLHYRERLASGMGFTASPVAAGGRVYFTSETGEVHVVREGKKLEVLAVNPLGETAMATPAISGDILYFRTRGHLLAISNPQPAQSLADPSHR